MNVNKKKKWIRIDPWDTPAITGLHNEVYPFNTTLWNLPHK